MPFCWRSCTLVFANSKGYYVESVSTDNSFVVINVESHRGKSFNAACYTAGG